MLRALLKTVFAAFGRRYDYDTRYMREIADLDVAGALRLAMISPFTTYRFGLPAEVYHAAKVVAVRHADCGPCLRLAVRMAAEEGVSSQHLAALLAGSPDVPERMALAARYAEAVAGNLPKQLDLVEECRSHWGDRGVAGLAAAVVSGMVYPTLKRGMGYGAACAPVLAELRAGGLVERTNG